MKKYIIELKEIEEKQTLMKKFKLIKDYPNSINLGDEVVFDLQEKIYKVLIKETLFSPRRSFKINEVENKPEFWKEIPIIGYTIFNSNDKIKLLYKYEDNDELSATVVNEINN